MDIIYFQFNPHKKVMIKRW